MYFDEDHVNRYRQNGKKCIVSFLFATVVITVRLAIQKLPEFKELQQIKKDMIRAYKK